MNGHFYPRNGRWWWKVTFPGEKKSSQIALKPAGAKFATKDRQIAEIIAGEIWRERLRHQTSESWDGKLTTLVKKYHSCNVNYYLPPSKQADHIARAIFPLADYYPDLLAEDFSSLHLKKFQKFVVKSDKYDWSRKIINRHISFIKRMFKWAASEMLVSIYTYRLLKTVENLHKGRTTAREEKNVGCVTIEQIDAVRPFLTAIICDMIGIQLLTAMRPGELVKLRPCDIDRSNSDVWLYRPTVMTEKEYAHKTEIHDQERIICIGKKAQAILTKYLFRDDTDFCFKPAESEKMRKNTIHNNRKTPLSCGNKPGTNKKGAMKYNDRYDTHAYYNAIKRACEHAWPPPEHLRPKEGETKKAFNKRISKTEKDKIKEWNKKHRWTPNQLRHTMATEIRSKFKPDEARTVLGHKKVDTTLIYAEKDLKKAMKVAKMIG